MNLWQEKINGVIFLEARCGSRFHLVISLHLPQLILEWKLYEEGFNPQICSFSQPKNVWRKTVWCILEKGSYPPSNSLSWQRLYTVTQELRDFFLKKGACHGKLPAWSWVQTALFGWRDALEPIWIKKCDIRKAYFHRQGWKYVLSALSTERLLNLCLQYEERSQHRWLGTKGRGLFLMPLNGSLLFLS